MSQPVAYLTRRETFCAGHRLNSKHLTPEENFQTYGKCNNVNGHGHNYVVEVTVCGPIDCRTSMVMNITDLKNAMNSVILKTLDHKNIDKDVEYFKNIPSSMENIAVYIWDNLYEKLEQPELLYEIRICETEKNSVIYRGQRVQKHSNGNYNGNLNGKLNGNVNGNINGKLNGNLNGNYKGNLNGNGHIYLGSD